MSIYLNRLVAAMLVVASLGGCQNLDYGEKQTAGAVIGGVGPSEFYEKVCGAFVIPGSEVGIYGPLFELRAAEPA